MPHVERPVHARRFPLHVTMRLADGLPSLRGDAAREVVRATMHRNAERYGLRLVHYSAQRDHLHLIAEAEDASALSRGMQSLAIRLALALNRLWQRKGALVGDRYHARALRTPREVRIALAYVLCNARKHGERFLGALDPCSSAPSFDGWRELVAPPRERSFLARARTWLLAIGWKLHGPVDPRAVSAPSSTARSSPRARRSS